MHYNFFLKGIFGVFIFTLPLGGYSYGKLYNAIPADSIGVEKRNGKSYIIHKVTPKETLYAISRKYHVTVEEITENNPDVETRDIRVGDTLQIPLNEEFYKQSSGGNTNNAFHKVEEQETLYSIATQYNVSVDDLMTWNDLESTNIDVGQRLKINTPGSDYNQEEEVGSDAPVMHEVKPSETLYSISQKYNVEVDDIKEWNNLMDQNIVIGQGLKIFPDGMASSPKNKNKAKVSTKPTPKNEDQKFHEVKPEETLYSIAVNYNIKVEEIMDWNDLESEIVKPGQKLKIAANTDSSASEKDQKEITSQGNQEQMEEEEEPVNENQELTAENPEPGDKSSMEARKKRFMEQKAREEKQRNNYKRITNTGLAEKIEGTADTEKFLALHRTAPIGTIMEVKNEMNNLSLFVRIIGRLPDTGENDKVLIKISQKAFEGLEAVNNKFPVEISYIP